MATTDYYTPTGAPSTGAFAASAVVRSEFDDVSDGFAKLPALSAGAASRAVVLSSDGLSLTTTTGTFALAGNLAFTGAFNTTFVAGATVSITLPTVTGLTLATLTGTETLTNKTISGSANTLTAIGNASLTNSSITVNGSSVSLGGSVTVTAVASSIVVGTTTISSGTTTNILYNNAGTLGEYTITGSGTVVAMKTGAVLIGPTLGVATATSINGLTISTSTGTFTLTNSKTLSVTNTLTLSGADSTVMTFPSTSATIARTDAANTFTGVQTMATSLTMSQATGPQISLTGGTSNWITLGAAGSAAPSFTTRSAGTKIVLYEAVAGAATDYAIGITGTAVWFGTTTTSASFLWYGGTTVAASLTGAGELTLVAGLTATTINGNTFTTGTGVLTIAASKTLTVSNTITLAGTDSTVMTFPTTSATIARTDAGQTFTGVQTMTSPAITTPAFTGQTTGTWTVGGTVTINAFTLAGTIAGGGNQINNVIIGTSTPLAGSFTTVAASTSVTATSASAVALAVGLAGATNPAFVVDSSTGSQAAGLKITGAATGGTVALVAIDSGAATNLTINAKGAGTIGIGSVSTGAVTITPATTITGAITAVAADNSFGTGQTNYPILRGNGGGFAGIGLGGTGNCSLVVSTIGSGSFIFNTANGGSPNGGTTQMTISHTASASRYINVTGSNGGNPTISTSAGSLAITPAVAMNDATDSSSITTGALVVAGGVGISKKLYVGDQLNVAAVTTLQQTLVVGTLEGPIAGGSRIITYGNAGPQLHIGSGAPTSSASKGSLYLRTDGSSTSTRLYVNTDAGTTWAGITTTA